MRVNLIYDDLLYDKKYNSEFFMFYTFFFPKKSKYNNHDNFYGSKLEPFDLDMH